MEIKEWTVSQNLLKNTFPRKSWTDFYGDKKRKPFVLIKILLVKEEKNGEKTKICRRNVGNEKNGTRTHKDSSLLQFHITNDN